MATDFQAMLDMMQGQQDTARAEREKLQAMVAAPSQEGFLNEGQGAMDLLLDPTERQRQSMVQMGLSMMGADPRQSVGQTISQGVGKGMSLMDSLREKDRARELQAQSLAVKGADTDYGYMKDMASMMPDPVKPSWTNVQNPDGSTSFIDRTLAGHGSSAGGAAVAPKWETIIGPDGNPVQVDRNVVGHGGSMGKPDQKDMKGNTFNYTNMDLPNSDGTVVPQMVKRVTSGPEAGKVFKLDGTEITGEAAQTITGRTLEDQKWTSKAAHQFTNSALAANAFDTLSTLLDGNMAENATAIIAGSMPIPTEVGQAFKLSRLVVTNVIGRLESGGQIRENEMGNYEKMLIPTLFDVVNPAVMRKKLRSGAAIQRIEMGLVTGRLSLDNAYIQLNEIMADTSGGVGSSGSTGAQQGATEEKTASGIPYSVGT